jgi:hypothetical protein
MGEDRDGLVSVTIPAIASQVADHHRRANSEIDGMSPSRKWGAETNLRSWRRWVKEVDPSRENSWGFSGVEVKTGTMVSLPAGAVIVTCDVSWAQAKWYAGRYIKPTEIEASLYEVTSDGPKHLVTAARRKWARELIDWLITNRPGIPQKTSVAPARSATP